jgi:D-3-phosphoglycerate dehydrogenase
VYIWIIDEEWAGYDREEALLKKEFPGVEIKYSKNGTYRDDLEEAGKQADAVICQISVEMSADIINGLKKCKVISVYGAGYNNVDVQAAKLRGIAVCNVPGYCVEDVSDWVIGAIYYCNKKIGAWDEAIAAGKWGAGAGEGTINRLSASTLLIVGYGRIGKAAAAKASALGMKVLIYSPSGKKPEGGLEGVSLKEGLSRADFVSIHTALNRETTKLVNRDFFSMMKKGAYFINASRGKVVDEAALIEAVKTNRIKGAVVDVVETEPPEKESPILHTRGITVTPHIAYLSEDALAELQETAARNAADILKGRKTDNTVKI